MQVATRAGGIPNAAVLRKLAARALEQDCELTLRIVGRPEARRLNRDFRGKDYATNVLTFVYAPGPPVHGDIVICAPVVTREARQLGRPLRAHWAHLAVHGMLHLQGYDHERSARAARRMERREAEILGDLGYPDPYLMAA